MSTELDIPVSACANITFTEALNVGRDDISVLRDVMAKLWAINLAMTIKHKPRANRKRQKNRTVRGYWAKS